MPQAVSPTVARQNDEEANPSRVAIPLPEVALLVLTRLLQGDRDMLMMLGLCEADVYPLRALPSESLSRLLSRVAGGELIEIRLHREALQRFLQYLQTDSRSEREIRSMIEAEASHPFMQHFYGMCYADYHHYRQQAGLLRPAGRPTTPTAVVIAEIECLLHKLDLLAQPAAVGPFDLLAIHQLTGYSLREVWWVYEKLTRDRLPP